MSNHKIPQATHSGELKIGDFSIDCAVLEDGTRVLTQESFLKALGRNPKAKGGEGASVDGLPAFLRADNLKSFITDDIAASTKPIVFKTLRGAKAYGYNATLLPLICRIFLEARDAKKLKPSQKHIAQHADIMIRGLAQIGIISLVDEATGYQHIRERDALQRILKAYISEELLKWQKKFPDTFYQEIFRLNGWDYTVSNITKRPGVVGTWTKKLIYEQLPPGVLDELKRKTPKSASGNYTARLHQSLTEDIGDPHLQGQINSVIALMQISDDWKELIRNFNKMIDRRRGQTELQFEDLEPKTETNMIESPTTFDTQLKGLLAVPSKDKSEV